MFFDEYLRWRQLSASSLLKSFLFSILVSKNSLVWCLVKAIGAGYENTKKDGLRRPFSAFY